MEKPRKETLERLYVQESKSLADIGRLYGVHKNQVRRWLLQAAVPVRSKAEGTRLSGKFGVHSEAHREKLRANAARAREGVTPESRAKQSATRKAKKIVPWNKGKPMSEAQRLLLTAQRQSTEYREAAAARQRGPLSHAWKGGTTDAEKRRMQGWEWRQRRQEVYERDGYKCQDCGVKCLGRRDAHQDPKRKIACHHIVRRRDGGTDDLANLVTLCASCHLRREARYSGALFA